MGVMEYVPPFPAEIESTQIHFAWVTLVIRMFSKYGHPLLIIAWVAMIRRIFWWFVLHICILLEFALSGRTVNGTFASFVIA